MPSARAPCPPDAVGVGGHLVAHRRPARAGPRDRWRAKSSQPGVEPSKGTERVPFSPGAYHALRTPHPAAHTAAGRVGSTANLGGAQARLRPWLPPSLVGVVNFLVDPTLTRWHFSVASVVQRSTIKMLHSEGQDYVQFSAGRFYTSSESLKSLRPAAWSKANA